MKANESARTETRSEICCKRTINLLSEHGYLPKYLNRMKFFKAEPTCKLPNSEKKNKVMLFLNGP